MKRENFFIPNDQTAIWRNADNPNERFTDYRCSDKHFQLSPSRKFKTCGKVGFEKFIRSLTPEERNQTVAHFINGLASPLPSNSLNRIIEIFKSRHPIYGNIFFDGTPYIG